MLIQTLFDKIGKLPNVKNATYCGTWPGGLVQVRIDFLSGLAVVLYFDKTGLPLYHKKIKANPF